MVATVKCDTITEASNTGTANISLDSSGNVTIGNNLTVNGTTTQTGQTLFPDGSVSAPSISNTGDTNCGIYFPAADTLGFVTSGTEDGRFDSIGNLLLNSATLSPTQTAAGSIAMTGTLAMGSSFKRNRIINGDMRVDQRNAGASGTGNGYTVDRFAYFGAAASKGTWQQNAGSVTPPAGFTNYLGFTSSSAYTVGASEQFNIYQPIEGLNISDLGWGTANARTVTLSFWVRSSLTGTFGGSIYNSAVNRSYPFSYIITALQQNQWVYQTITIAGDTSGTWLTTNGVGLYLNFGLGAGSTVSNTAGSWYAGRFDSATGATSVVGTNGATWYVTGVQLEVGSVATPYERQIYSEQLAQCQRYYAALGAGSPAQIFSSTSADAVVTFPVTMRATPTVAHLANYTIVLVATAEYTVTATAINGSVSGTNTTGCGLRLTSTGMTTGSAWLTNGNNIGFNSEL